MDSCICINIACLLRRNPRIPRARNFPGPLRAHHHRMPITIGIELKRQQIYRQPPPNTTLLSFVTSNHQPTTHHPPTANMPPRQVTRGRVEEPSYVRGMFGALTSADNRSIVTAVGLFAVSILHSSLSLILNSSPVTLRSLSTKS